MAGSSNASRRHALKSYASVQVAVNKSASDALINVIQKDIILLGSIRERAKTLISDLDLVFGGNQVSAHRRGSSERRALGRGNRSSAGRTIAAAVAGLKSGFEHKKSLAHSTGNVDTGERDIFNSFVPIGRRLNDGNLLGISSSIRNAMKNSGGESDE